MELPVLHALDPFLFFQLNLGFDLNQVKLACQAHHNGVMVLPEAATTLEDLQKCLSFGASIILKHSDLRTNTLSAVERDTLIDEGKEKVFMKGYSDGHCLRFLQKGASLLFDGVENPINPATLQQLCGLPHTGKIRVLGHGYSDANRRDLLRRGIRMVYSWRTGQPHAPVDALEKDAQVGKTNMIVHLSDWSLAQALDLLKAGATMLITGHTRWNRQQIENEIIHPASAEERGRINMLYAYGPQPLLNDLRQMALIFSLEEVSANVLFN